MFSLDKSQLPCGLKNARLISPVSRCGFIDENLYRNSEFKSYRDIFDEKYDYVVPLSNKNIPDYVRKSRSVNYPDRLSQFEVEQIILRRIHEENVLLQRLFTEASKKKSGYITKGDLYSIMLHLCPQMKYKQFEEILLKCDLDKYTAFFLETIQTQLMNLTFKEKLNAFCDVDASFRRIKGTNALHRLKLKAMDPDFDLKELLPPSVFEPQAIVLMPQLREALCRIDIRMTDTEFLRFWEKFDKMNVGSIPTKFLLEMLNLQDNGLPMCGIRLSKEYKLLPKEPKSMKRPPCDAKYRCLILPDDLESKEPKAGGISFPITRVHGWKPQDCGGTNYPELGKGTRYLQGLKSLMNSHPKYDAIIEKLCYIFQAPYHAMLVIFHHYDQRNRGKVSIDESMEIFLEYGFSIIWKDFLEFLKRAGCIFDHSFVKYRQLLEKYQTKHELSYVDRAIKLIIQTQYEDIGLKTLTTMSPSEIEQHLIKLLHGPYIKLMEELQKKCDSKYTVDMQTMRHALERHVLGESISNDQWNDLIPYFALEPLAERIPYKKFLYLFSKPSKTCKGLCPQPPLKFPKEKPWDTSKYERDPRDLLHICILIERLLKKKFHIIDKYYKYSEKDEMYDFKEHQFRELLLSQKLNLTLTETRMVWDVLKLKLPFAKSYQMILKFMMSQLVKTARAIKIKEKYDSNKGYYDRNTEVLAAYKANKIIEKQRKEELLDRKINPNIKTAVIQSNISDIIEKIKSTVHQQWDTIKAKFIQLDVIGSTTIENYQMTEVCAHMFPQLSKQEVLSLIAKFDLRSNGRFNYVKFLMEFQKKSDVPLAKYTFDSYSHSMTDKKSKDTYHMTEVREMIRKLLISKWKNLLSAFRKLDECKLGFLEISQIDGVLKRNKICLKTDDLYHILTNFDKNMDGKIDYFEFIKEILDINLTLVN